MLLGQPKNQVGMTCCRQDQPADRRGVLAARARGSPVGSDFVSQGTESDTGPAM